MDHTLYEYATYQYRCFTEASTPTAAVVITIDWLITTFCARLLLFFLASPPSTTVETRVIF